jgi:hypothetical protein
MKMSPDSDGTDRLVQLIQFDPSISYPYQDLDGTIPVIAGIRHVYASRGPLIVAHVTTSTHPHIARGNISWDHAHDLGKSHGS